MAHQPRIVEGYGKKIINPEISQAFYGELKENYHFYTLTSEEDFDFYVQLMLPYDEDSRKDMSVVIAYENRSVITRLKGIKHNWTYYYEEHGGDEYYWGPEYSERLKAGLYKIWIYNKDNKGKYILVVGKKESFPFKEIMKLFVTLPKVKSFFGKPEYMAFLNLIGLYLLLAILAIAIVAYWTIESIKKPNKKNKKKKSHHRRHAAHTHSRRRHVRPS
jgi:hypothetical protein